MYQFKFKDGMELRVDGKDTFSPVSLIYYCGHKCCHQVWCSYLHVHYRAVHTFFCKGGQPGGKLSNIL